MTPENALSLIFSPIDRPHTSTINHLLSLPPLIQSLSPPLAALHLARIRLQLSIPATSLKDSAWCMKCGGLRENRIYNNRRKLKSKSKSISKSRVKLSGETKKIQTTMKGNSIIEGDELETDRGRERGRGRVINNTQCQVCGSKFTRIKPSFDPRLYPPARRVRACRQQITLDHNSQMTVSETHHGLQQVDDIFGKPANFKNSSLMNHSFSDTSSPIPIPPSYISTPSLSHIHTSSPNPPTYPQPPPRVNSPPKSSKSKKKKSGLARLLAENKEREADRSVGGGWGLD